MRPNGCRVWHRPVRAEMSERIFRPCGWFLRWWAWCACGLSQGFSMPWDSAFERNLTPYSAITRQTLTSWLRKKCRALSRKVRQDSRVLPLKISEWAKREWSSTARCRCSQPLPPPLRERPLLWPVRLPMMRRQRSRGPEPDADGRSGPQAPPSPPLRGERAIYAPSPPKPQSQWRSGPASPPIRRETIKARIVSVDLASLWMFMGRLPGSQCFANSTITGFSP